MTIKEIKEFTLTNEVFELKVEDFDSNLLKYEFELKPFKSSKGYNLLGIYSKTNRKGFWNTKLTSGKISIFDNDYDIFRKPNGDKMWIKYTGRSRTAKIDNKFLTDVTYHEDNIKAEIYKRLGALGISCELEYNKFQNCRIDVVVKDSKNNIIGAIEVKKPTKNEKYNSYSNIKLTKEDLSKYEFTPQIYKYIMLDIPIFVCRGYNNIPKALDFAKQLKYN